MPWSPLPVETDPDVVTVRILEAMRTALPGWEPYEGTPEVVLAEEIARESVVLAVTAQAVMEEAVAGMGQTVFGIPTQPAVAATIPVRLTVSANGVVPAGFTVIGITDAGVEVAFQLAVETPAAVPSVDVTMTAVLPGAAANSVPTGDLTVVTATAVVTSAAALDRASGGVDEETRVQYLNRLTDYLATLRPGGVRAIDLALLARSVPGVHRALGIDLLDPAAPGVSTERTATVFLVDADGLPVDTDVAAEALAKLDESREVNFNIHIGIPTYTPVDVTFEAVAEAGADPTAVRAAVRAAIAAFLSPARWGSVAGDDQAWVNTSKIRYLDLARAAGSADGVAALIDLQIDGGTVDVVLTGPAPLPAPTSDPLAPTTIDGTVV